MEQIRCGEQGDGGDMLRKKKKNTSVERIGERTCGELDRGRGIKAEQMRSFVTPSRELSGPEREKVSHKGN